MNLTLKSNTSTFCIINYWSEDWTESLVVVKIGNIYFDWYQVISLSQLRFILALYHITLESIEDFFLQNSSLTSFHFYIQILYKWNKADYTGQQIQFRKCFSLYTWNWLVLNPYICGCYQNCHYFTKLLQSHNIKKWKYRKPGWLWTSKEKSIFYFIISYCLGFLDYSHIFFWGNISTSLMTIIWLYNMLSYMFFMYSFKIH